MSYELTGKVKLIQEAQTFGSGFQKREMVVTVEAGKYPQDINIEFVQDRIDLISDLRAGDEVTVTFDIRGREYNGRYFNSLNGWKLVCGSKSSNTQSPPPPQQPDFSDDYEEDVPF